MLNYLESKLTRETTGLIYGLMGVAGFSLTLPATRLAVKDLDPVLVGFGRAVIAAIVAFLILVLTRQKFPSKSQIKSLAIVASGVIIGFPILSAVALQHVPSSHGAIIVGIIPLVTVIAGAILVKERPSLLFWMFSLTGAIVIFIYALIKNSGTFKSADLALIGAVIFAAFGYAEGAKLSKVLGGWKVISWALVLSFPLLIGPVIFVHSKSTLTEIPVEAWISFAYVIFVSQFLAFFPWYKGLAMGGIAKVGQVQLLQPFLTILASAFLIGERIDYLTIVTMIIVGVIVFTGRKTSVKRT